MRTSVYIRIKSAITIVILLTMIGCAAKTSPDLPKDILGISVGMSKADAQRRLEEIATFESEGRKVGQLWRLKDDPRFSNIAVAYDANNQIRFVTALVEKTTAKQRIKFTEVGDLTKAKAEIVEPHYRYIWEVPAEGGEVAYIVNVYGANPEFVDIYALSAAKKNQSDKVEE